MVAENLRHWRIQLVDRRDGTIIQTAGGAAIVTVANSPLKLALKNADGSAGVNPVVLNRGSIDFYTAATVDAVDIFGIGPGGVAIEAQSVQPSGPNEILVDGGDRSPTYRVPVHITDFPATVEVDTGLDLPAGALIFGRFGGSGIFVSAIDATETIDVGTLTAEAGGDPNGLQAATPVGVAGATVATDGALIATNIPYSTDAQVAKSLAITTTAGSDTLQGYVYVAARLMAD